MSTTCDTTLRCMRARRGAEEARERSLIKVALQWVACDGVLDDEAALRACTRPSQPCADALAAETMAALQGFRLDDVAQADGARVMDAPRALIPLRGSAPERWPM
eukprot:CAMPEP_0170318350 /NCGR_PEP_ID=MMETSP0116_2-20130129/59870_1 /TAXON_ID=400756 /ORGANISM="Durinskia baltica, Strain CSIRO CS-38" /LENGTH=104 /DNA_ID=CAMNT_0010571043 /DNA_START=160 /DNA_END=475 /DNA_ORIENTATION=+